jgi:hypothetical protein
MNSIDRISSAGNNMWTPPAGAKKAEAAQMPVLAGDSVDLHISADNKQQQTVQTPVNDNIFKAVNAPSKELTLEKIDTALEAASTPIGDAALLSTVTGAITSGKTMQAKGTVNQGGKKYDVSLNLKANAGSDSGNILGERGYDYQLTGKIGTMPMSIHCYSSGLSLFLEGKIGENQVALKNSYSILSGKVTTKGSIGSVPVNLESKANDNVFTVKGDIGGSAFDEKLTQYSNGSKAEGKLGNLAISGSSTTAPNGVMTTTSQIGDVLSKYEVKLG